MKLLLFIVGLSYVSSSAIKDSSPIITAIPNGISGEGVSTTYWDCCAPSCAWDGNTQHAKKGPVKSCQKDGWTWSSPQNNDKSGCQKGGVAYTCNGQQPIWVNATLAYGWAAASFSGGSDSSKCCSCMLLDLHGPLQGKKYLVQIVNTGTDLKQNHFDLQIPGGGVGIFNLGCMTQWNTGPDGWGRRYGGVSTIEECNQLPAVLQNGCKFKFTFLSGITPTFHFQEVKCPPEIVKVSNCDVW